MTTSLLPLLPTLRVQLGRQGPREPPLQGVTPELVFVFCQTKDPAHGESSSSGGNHPPHPCWVKTRLLGDPASPHQKQPDEPGLGRWQIPPCGSLALLRGCPGECPGLSHTKLCARVVQRVSNPRKRMGCRRPWEGRARGAQREQGMGINQAACGLAGEMGKREREAGALPAGQRASGRIILPFPKLQPRPLAGIFFFF